LGIRRCRSACAYDIFGGPVACDWIAVWLALVSGLDLGRILLLRVAAPSAGWLGGVFFPRSGRVGDFDEGLPTRRGFELQRDASLARKRLARATSSALGRAPRRSVTVSGSGRLRRLHRQHHVPDASQTIARQGAAGAWPASDELGTARDDEPPGHCHGI